MKGKIINNKYEIIELLGKGGMGTVYKTRDQITNSIIALKVLSAIHFSRAALSHFEKEFTTLSQLVHPNLIKVFDFGVSRDLSEDGTALPFFTMELVDGETIDRFFKRDINFDIFYNCIAQAAEGISYIHRKGLLHNDIKSSNIMITRGTGPLPLVKIMDFGLIERTVDVKREEVAGTVSYVAPEKLKAGKADERSDIYSLGVVLYEVAAGRLPFAGESPALITEAHLREKPLPPSTFNREIPSALEEMILKCLEKDPARRFQSSEALTLALHRISGFRIKTSREEIGKGYILSGGLVGRSHELEKLKTAFEHAREGKSGFILIDGEAGTGKTRLLKEFRIHAQISGIPFYASECYENLLIPYGPIIDVVEGIIRVREEQLKELIKESCPELVRIIPSLSEKEYLKDEKVVMRPAAMEESSRLVSSLSKFFIETSMMAPYVIIFENINWIDEASASFLLHLLSEIEGEKANLLILSTSRTDELRENSSASRLLKRVEELKIISRILLKELDISEVKELLVSMTGNIEIPEKFLKKVMDETKGNPLFIEEFMSLLVDRGMIMPGEKIFPSEEEIKTLAIPDKIFDLLQRKISRIDESDLMLLRAASITGGKAIDPETLTSITGKKWDYVIEHLNRLSGVGILEKIKVDGSEEIFRFKNMSLRRIIYREIDKDARVRFHHDYATYLDRRYHNRSFLFGELAHHFKNGGLLGKAADCYSKAGDHAAEVAANMDAISFYSSAIDIMLSTGFSNAGQLLCQLFEKRGKVRELTGDLQKAEEDYRWMMARAESDKNKKQTGKAYVNIGGISFNQSRFTEALENYRKASEILEGIALQDDLAFSLNRIGMVQMKLGNFQESHKDFERSLAMARKLKNPGLEIQNLSGLAHLSRETGEYRDSIRYFEEAERIARESGDEKNAVAPVEGIAMSLEIQGKIEAAIQKYHEALDIASRSGNILAEANIKTNLGSLYSRIGNNEKSFPLFEDAIRVYSRLRAMEGIISNLHNLSTLYLHQGQYQKALDSASESLKIALKVGKKDLIAISYNLIGGIHLKLGDIENARVNLEEAKNIMRNIKSIKWLSSFLIDLGELNLFREDFERAKRNLQEACFIARKIGNKMIESTGFLRLAEACLGEKDFGKSIKAVNKAFELAEESMLKKELSDAQLLMARVEIEKPGGDILKAENLASSALEAYRELKETERLWQANYILGRIFMRRGRHAEAIELFRRTHRFLEGIRSMLPDKWRRTFLNDPRRREFYYEWEKLKGKEKEEAAVKLEREGIGHAAEFSIIKRKADNLSRLMEINKKINSTLDLNELLETIIQTAIDLTAAERGFLILVEDGKMKFEVARSVDGTTLKKPEYDISKSIAEKVMEEGTPLISIDAQEDDRFIQYVSVHALKLRSVIAMPLRSKGKIIGSIYLDSRLGKGVFTHDHLELLSLFSDQAGIALENARLYDELELKKKDIEVLNRELEKTVHAQRSEIEDIKVELQEKQSTLEIRYRYGNIVGMSPKMKAIYEIIDRVADSKIPVLIYGESGTGKELIARAIHYNSIRKKNRFFTVNCAALTETLLESELFGYRKGAFTGADKDKKGFFEIASGGTILLDEVGDMSLSMQSKLLRVLQDGEILPVGGKDIIKVDVRIISATNKNLKGLIERGAFREDLYFRLNVANIQLPPLRERKEDISLLIEHFLSKFSEEEKKPRKSIDGAAIKLLAAYDWPGNIRELEHEITKIATFCKGEVITEKDVRKYSTFYKEEEMVARIERSKKIADMDTLEDMEKKHILEVLDATENNKSKTAEILGIDRATLFRKLKKYGINQ
ncbi:MAG: sigma 54-interacting transcriptional regulator [Acidobacteriota bacterium]